MADDPVLRIVIQDQGQPGAPTQPAGTTPSQPAERTIRDVSDEYYKALREQHKQEQDEAAKLKRSMYPPPYAAPKPELDLGEMSDFFGPEYRKKLFETEKKKLDAQIPVLEEAEKVEVPTLEELPSMQESVGKLWQSFKKGDLAGGMEAVDNLGLSAGMGGIEGVAAAAGPAAAILIAKEVGDYINATVTDAIKGGIGGAGGVVTEIATAHDHVSPAVQMLGDAASKAGEKLESFAPVTGYAIVAIGETTKALGNVMAALDQTAQKYSEYNSQIAMAEAQNEASTMLADINRANELGPELSRYVDAQSNLQTKYEDAKVQILERILPIISTILETVTMVIPSGETIGAAINTLTDPLGTIASAIADLIGMQRADKLPDVQDPTDLLFRGGLELPVAGDPRN